MLLIVFNNVQEFHNFFSLYTIRGNVSVKIFKTINFETVVHPVRDRRADSSQLDPSNTTKNMDTRFQANYKISKLTLFKFFLYFGEALYFE